ncbi:spermidine synthase [Devriesea agamarum]|uniref:spermidine synthase n=1 Tax=Devriesea agamarum TaxID=472569 RepID=UPI000AE60116|nr:fused MFS/spermidine synthase [Devriesea agamarum]
MSPRRRPAPLSASRSRKRDNAPQPPFDQDVPIDTGIARLARENDGSVVLYVNGVPSSQHHPEPSVLIFEYQRWMHTVISCVLRDRETAHERSHASGPRIAHLGGGGCSLPRALAATHPTAQQTVVEIDGALVRNARTWFDLPRSPRLRIREDDAVRAVQQWSDNKFDIVTRDVFSGDTTPRSVRDLGFTRHISRILAPGGLYIANCADRPGFGLLADEVATASAVFPHVNVVAEPGQLKNRRYGNYLVLAGSQPIPTALDRELRRDAVTVRLVSDTDLHRIAQSGTITDVITTGAAPSQPADPSSPG